MCADDWQRPAIKPNEKRGAGSSSAETDDVEGNAHQKLREKNLDWIVANDVSHARIGMNADDNTVLLTGAAGARVVFGPTLTGDVAEFLLNQIAPVSAAITLPSDGFQTPQLARR